MVISISIRPRSLSICVRQIPPSFAGAYCDQAVEQRFCVGAADFNFGERADIHNPNALANAVLLTHAIVDDVATKAVVVFLSFLARRKPTRTLVSVDFLKNSTLGF